jgi:hypothetical protein
MSAVEKNSDEPESMDETVTEEEGADPVEDQFADEEEASDPRGKVLSILPVHAAPNTGKNPLKVQRQRGRPRKVERMPTTSDLQYHAEMTAAKQEFVENDPVVKQTLRRGDPVSMLHTLKTEVAREAAALSFQRIENEKHGKDTAQISSRRIEALSKIAAIELEIKKQGGDVLDLRSEKFQRIFKFWIQTLQEVAAETLSPEMIDLLFNRLGTRLENWEEQAGEIAKDP